MTTTRVAEPVGNAHARGKQPCACAFPDTDSRACAIASSALILSTPRS